MISPISPQLKNDTINILVLRGVRDMKSSATSEETEVTWVCGHASPAVVKASRDLFRRQSLAVFGREDDLACVRPSHREVPVASFPSGSGGSARTEVVASAFCSLSTAVQLQERSILVTAPG